MQQRNKKQKKLCQNTDSYFLMLETELLHRATSKLFTQVLKPCVHR